MQKLIVYPAILSKTYKDYAYKIRTAQKYFSGVQIDVMDGRFVKNKTFSDFRKINRLKPRTLFFEIHLMVENPLDALLRWAKVADRYIIHRESSDDIAALIKVARALNKSVGLAINPKTPTGRLQPFLSLIDTVLIMAVHPGKSGQRFIPSTLTKIKNLRKSSPKMPIEVDGGINEITAPQAVRVGANIIVAGKYLWKDKKNIKQRKELLEQVCRKKM